MKMSGLPSGEGILKVRIEQNADILLVEDDIDDVTLALAAFEAANLGNKLHVARDGVEALEFLFPASDEGNPRKPGLILLDLKLPRLDGHEVLRRIKNDPRTSGISVIVLTGSEAERDVARTYEVGVNSYIVKPVDFEQFTEAVRNVGKYWLVFD
jgi:two-component system, response regulator